MVETMSITQRHIVLFGFDPDIKPALSPHKISVLPTGIKSLYTAYDVFDADLVVLAPDRNLFAPPADLEDARSLACEMAYGEVLPLSLADPLAAQYAAYHAQKDAELTKLVDEIKKGPRPTRRGTRRQTRSRTDADAPLVESITPQDALETLVTCGTWLLRQSFQKGQNGPQHVILFLPPHNGAAFAPAHEAHCTAPLLDYWLGIPQSYSAVTQDLAVKRLKWSPCAEQLAWPHILDLNQLLLHHADTESSFMQCAANPLVFDAGARRIDDESPFELRCVTQIKTEPSSPYLIQNAPLIASPDHSVTVGSVYRVNDLHIHVLPEPGDVADTVTRFVHDRWKHDDKQRLELHSGRPHGIKSIGVQPCAPTQLLSELSLNAGDMRGTGWQITINGQHRVGLGRTKFLQLLAFIVADRSGQAAGVSPARPRLRGKPLRNVFRTADAKNASLSKSDLNAHMTDACQALGVIASDQQFELITRTGEKGFYRLNPEYSSLVHVEIRGRLARDPTVKALMDLAGKCEWNPPVVEPSTGDKLWYQALPVNLPSDITV